MPPALQPLRSSITLGFIAAIFAGCSHANSDPERGPRTVTLLGDDIQYVHANGVEVMILQTGDEVSVQVNYLENTRMYDMNFSHEAIRSQTQVTKNGEMFVLVDEDGDGFLDLKSKFRPERKLYRITYSLEETEFPEK